MLTGQKDTDLLILDKLDNKDILNFSLINKKAYQLCLYEPFWINRFIKEHGYESYSRAREYKYCEKSWKNDIWLYKIKTEFPNYVIPNYVIPKENYKNIYINVLKNSIPNKIDRDKTYDIIELYKSVEKGYNTREEFENFVNMLLNHRLGSEMLIVTDEGTSLSDYVWEVGREKGFDLLRSGDVIIYFSYREKRVKYGFSSQKYREEIFVINIQSIISSIHFD